MNAATMRNMRLYHHYMGVLFAPLILFFAFSGALQTFDLHEVENGVKPPQWIAVIAALHKKQTLPRPRPPRPALAAPAAGPKDAAGAPATQGARALPAKRPGSPWPLKVVVGIMSIGLMLSTLTGLVIALNNRRTRRISVLLLVVGAVLPWMLIVA
ncbi:MAG: hypothetical protein WC803_00820 [Sphingomonas sp.]|jgi:uncharacterized iron-regulated membrane protein